MNVWFNILFNLIFGWYFLILDCIGVIFLRLSVCFICIKKCMCLFKLFNKINCVLGRVMVNMIFGKLGFVLILM